MLCVTISPIILTLWVTEAFSLDNYGFVVVVCGGGGSKNICHMTIFIHKFKLS